MGNKYTDKQKITISNQVFDLMMEGKSARKSCIETGVPLRTFLDWIDADKKLAVQYARAREIMIEAVADEFIDISDEKPEYIVDDKGVTRIDGASVQDKRVRADARKWQLSKIAPKKYGDKVQLSGDNEAPFTLILGKDDAGL